jgi:hypothetical protein
VNSGVKNIDCYHSFGRLEPRHGVDGSTDAIERIADMGWLHDEHPRELKELPKTFGRFFHVASNEANLARMEARNGNLLGIHYTDVSDLVFFLGVTRGNSVA